MYDHRYTATYLDCVHRYEHRPEVCDALRRALQELAVQPFGNPKLQTHAVKRAQPDTFTSYVEAIIVATSDQLFVIPAHRRASFCAQSSTDKPARFQVRGAPAEGSNHDHQRPRRCRRRGAGHPNVPVCAEGSGSVTGIARAAHSAASVQAKVNTLAGGGLQPR